MPLLSTKFACVPAGNTQPANAATIVITPVVTPKGVGGKAVLQIQDVLQLPTPDGNGNVNPVPVGPQRSTNIPNLFAADPAAGSAQATALANYEAALTAAAEAALAAGVDALPVASYGIMALVQMYFTAKGL